MLNQVAPQNSLLRERLRFAARRANLAVGRDLRRNFTRQKNDVTGAFRDLLTDKYLPSWYSGVDMHEYLSSREGQQAVRNHLFVRLEMDRYELIPWLDAVVGLRGTRILEVGCGTGSATVALAEQGAVVTAMDLHAEALLLAEARCKMHALEGVRFVHGNAENLAGMFGHGDFDLIILFAVLEHMTLRERDSALRAAWQLVQQGGHLCIGETPNRLWPYDAHTAQLPFFNWLPDELAYRYAARSPRPTLRGRFGPLTEESLLSFRREGRGMSYHELDLAWGSGYRVLSDQTSFLARRNPLKLLKRLLARDASMERALNAFAPEQHRGFFRQNLDILIKKDV